MTAPSCSRVCSLPGLLPALLVLFSYLYLKTRGKFLNLLIIYCVIGVVGALFGIL